MVECIRVRFFTLVRPSLGPSSFVPNVPLFQICYSSSAIILLPDSSSCFVCVVFIRAIIIRGIHKSCMGSKFLAVHSRETPCFRGNVLYDLSVAIGQMIGVDPLHTPPVWDPIL